MTTAQTVDEARLQAFVGRAIGDLGGAMTTLFCALGDRLGLFKSLSDNGPTTSDELSARLGLQERYVREWLRGMTAAGYLEHDPESARFDLPAEHAPVLSQETGPMFFGGVYQELLGALSALDRVADAFRSGGGAPQEAYSSDFWEGWRGSPRAGSRTCSSQNGFRPHRRYGPGSNGAHASPMSGAAPGAR
jgi:hypothetical protein